MKYLYHATFMPFLESILRQGLGNTAMSMYSDSKKYVVYLALEPEVAYSYAESADFIDELVDDEVDKWLDDIIVLKIDVEKLNKSKLFIDENVQDNDGATLEYHGIIPSEAIVDIVDEDGESIKDN